MNALRAGPPFLLGWYTSEGPPGGRSLSKDRDVRTYAKKAVGSPLPPYTDFWCPCGVRSVGLLRALAWRGCSRKDFVNSGCKKKKTSRTLVWGLSGDIDWPSTFRTAVRGLTGCCSGRLSTTASLGEGDGGDEHHPKRKEKQLKEKPYPSGRNLELRRG